MVGREGVKAVAARAAVAMAAAVTGVAARAAAGTVAARTGTAEADARAAVQVVAKGAGSG